MPIFKKSVLLILIVLFSQAVFPSGSKQTEGDEEKQSVSRDFVDFLIDYVEIKYSDEHFSKFIYVSIKRQKLFLIENKEIISEYDISTAKNGVGFDYGSEKTPTGLHYIREKLGDDVPLGGVLRNRHYTGEVADILADPIYSNKDNITTRIMWLGGKEKGLNQGGKNDSYNRLIYIHGTDEEGLIGTPVSHGCIRMRNEDVKDLYEKVEVGAQVVILNN